ncbi:MAG: hypothetical protein IJB43_08895 [Clostridia bacterium]|nr:hypothetical protein [Clostridia bacterium]
MKVQKAKCKMQNVGEFSRFAQKFSFEYKQLKVLIELFQKFAELETASRFNAKASAFASVLQNGEASLRHFGQSQYFPIVGKCSSCGFPKENGGVSREARVATCRRQVFALCHPLLNKII